VKDSASSPGTASKALSLDISSSITDIYGGLLAKPSPNGATGYFRVEKFGNRWMFVTPDGYAFWMRSVYNVIAGSNLYNSKYGGNGFAWGTNINHHLLSWGFNTLGEYSSTSPAIPIGAYGAADGNSIKLPFILLLTPALDSMQNPSSIGLPEAVKDIIAGVPTSAYNDFRGPLVDVYDSKFTTAASAEVTYWTNAFPGGFANKPGVVGITIDDADKLYGLKSGGNASVVKYPHPGYMIAVANFRYPGFADPLLHSKYAWIDFLKAKYNNSISGLNAAWGTGGSYTSFDDVPTTHTNEPEYTVGSRTINVNTGVERINNTSTDTPCAPKGSGSCAAVYVGYASSATLTPGQSVTIAGVGDTSFNGTFTVTTVVDSNHFIYTQAAAGYAISGSGTVGFTETATTFSFKIAGTPVTPSTMTLSIPGLGTATDNGSGILTGTNVTAGSSIDYNGGAVVLNTNSAPSSGTITATFTGNGYGVGTGVIDENGQHQAWMGSDPWMLSNASTGVQDDLNGFLYQFCLKYAQIQVAAIRAVDQNHLIFGPAALNNYGAMARPQVLQGLSDGGVQVFQLNYNPLTGDMSGDNATYDLTGKPAFIWYAVTGQADSALSGSGLAYGQPDFGTQAARGQHYASDMQTFLNARGANGDFYVMGFDWWDLYDATGGGENTNWGLYTPRDNAYDGREAIIVAGTDPWGYPTGGEAANYGDFLSAATRANVATTRAVITALKTP